MKNSSRQIIVKLNEIEFVTLKNIIHQAEQQKAKRARKNTTAENQRQLKLLDDQNKEGQD